MYVSGRVDIFDMVDIDLFTVVALNMMVLKLGYTGKFEPVFYNYLKPLTSLDEGLYALACEEDVRCLGTLARSFTLIEVYIEHGVTTLDSYLRAPRFRATLEEITDESGSIAANKNEKNVIDDVMRQLSVNETKLDGEAGFADATGAGVDSSGLSHDESFGVDDIDLNLNKPINLNVSQVKTQSKILVSEEPEVSRTQEPILLKVSTQEPIVAKVSNEGNGQEDESAPTDGHVFYDDEGIDIAYEIKYDVQYSEDAGTDNDDDDDIDKDFFVDEENEIVKPDVDVHLFGISMDLPFDNIGITNLVSNDVLEGEDVNVINVDGFDSDPRNNEKNYRKRRLAELRTKMEGVINASGQWKYSFYTGQKFTTPKETKDRVYLNFIESRRNLKLYKNDGVRIRARGDGKVPVFTMSQGTGPTGPNRGMEAGPSKSNSPTTRSKKRKNTVKAVQDQLQRELKYSMLRDCVVELQSTNPNTTVKIAVEMNTDLYLPARGIIPAIKTIYPSAEHVYCLRHIHENIKQGWCGQAYNDLLWIAASATNVRDFEKCRAKSDFLLNNICEVFNGKIVGEPVVGQDGLGESGAGDVIGLSAAAGEGGAGVANQAISDNGKFPMVDEEEVTSKKLAPMADEMIMLIKHCKRWYWNDPELENKWYKTQLYEVHLLLNPLQREELENELTSREKLAVLQVEFADMEG
uniref:PB1-like domain-containing protein n=1 Tax=Tanacetum cinerariifolium TaxID=118510 RepID=A0A6L2NAA1_TANCI|nr:hypothetical protein [Tanacetum cinerariifolium]